MHPSSIAQIDTITLRPYQIDAITQVHTARAKGKKSALVVLPTGTGKTEIFSKIIHDLQVPTLVLAHRKELLGQAKKKLLRYYTEDEIGLVSAGKADWNKPILVASVQTVRNRLPELQARGIRLAIVDEAHHTTKKNSYNKVLDALPEAFIVGFTATPERLDKNDITQQFGKPVYERDIVSMVNEHWLCDLRGIMVRTQASLDSVRKQMGDFNEHELAQALNEDERNALIVQAYKTHAQGKPAICFAINVEHAHELARAFNEQGISSIALDGKTPLEEREYYLEQFAQGKIKALVNCELFTEGFDAPFVECIIMARPTLSRGLFLQMIGRGTRLHEGKDNCIILDITDNCIHHRLTPQSFKSVMGMSTLKGDVSILEYLEDERKRAEAARLRALALQAERERVAREAQERASKFAQERERVEQVRKARMLQERKDVVFTEIDLLGNAAPWVYLPNGKIIIRVAYTTITISPPHAEDYTYTVVAEDKFTTKTLGYHVPLARAKAIAEIYAGEIEAKIAAKRNNLPTPKQLETLRKFRIAIPTGCTFGQASRLIGEKIAELDSRKGA